MAFGVRPDVELADARAKRDEARRVLARGIDPSDQMKLDKITASVAAANMFKAVAEEWFAKSEKEGLAPATLNKVRWLLTFAYASFGNRHIAEIVPHELLVPLRKFEARGKHESAKRLRSTGGQVFCYAIATARASRDISADRRGDLISVKVTHRAAVTTPAGVGTLLRSIDSYTGHALTLTAPKLMPHLFVRPGELRHAEWSEFDLDNAAWTMPARKTKNAAGAFRPALSPGTADHREHRS